MESGTELISETNFQVGLGHRRLSIIDLTENGKQPMQFEQFDLTFNGEIYNYKEITRRIRTAGTHF